MKRKIICAIDTGDIDEACRTVSRLAGIVGAFKIGHALTLPHGLDVIGRLRDAGAERIYLDAKLHDIPNSVALAVEQATRKGVWALTLHVSGGPAMMTAAVEAARSWDETGGPLLIGVSVLTSIDQHVLSDHLGVNRSLEDHMAYMAKLGVECGLDGVVCGTNHVRRARQAIGHAIIVTSGIRMPSEGAVSSAVTALQDGADYLVIGRALTSAEDPFQALTQLGLVRDGRQLV